MQSAFLEPVAAGQTRFRMPGLAPDPRGIAVSREALMIFESLERVVAFLGAYSEEASLDELTASLTIERGERVGGGHALLVRCAANDGYSVDRLLRLANAARGRTYVGSGETFVRTRERVAPFGYDLAMPAGELPGVEQGRQNVVAVDLEYVARYVAKEAIDPVELIQRLELRAVPLPDFLAADPELGGLRELALVLVAPGLAERVLAYLWRNEVPMAGVRLAIDDDRSPSLLLRLRQPTARILDVLRPIPGVELFAPVSPRAAVELGYRHPIHLSSASSCLPGTEMYLFRGRLGRVERIDGAPRFVDGRHLVGTTMRLRNERPGELKGREIEALRVDLVLRPTSRSREPRAALVPWEALGQLRRLVYLIPPSALAASRVVALPEGVLVVSGVVIAGRQNRPGAAAGSLIPLGSRFVEVAPGVLVPDGYELWPRVRPSLVKTLLGLEGEDHALFLGPERQPLKLASSQLSPLDAAAIGRLSLDEAEPVAPALPGLAPGRIENERVGRFALWGFREGE